MLTPELIAAFDRLSSSLQEVIEALPPDDRSVAEQSLPQLEAQRAARDFGLDVAVVLLDDGRGGLKVAGEVGLAPTERRKAIRYGRDLWWEIFHAGTRVLEEEDRARFAKAGIPGSAGGTVLVIPLVHDDVGFGLLLAGARADEKEPAAFDSRKTEAIAAYARVIKPVLWSWVLAGHLKLRPSDEW
jgi:hypothetical protein